jgi:DNA-binding NarL/FixJ family response regulator
MRILERLADRRHANPHAVRVLTTLPQVPDVEVEALTERQIEVLRLVERGCSNKAIARDLGLSLSTVKTHLRTAFSRLNAASRTQAIARARERGVL